MKQCIEALQKLRCMELQEINVSFGLADEVGFSVASKPKECVIPTNEANIIVLLIIFKTSPITIYYWKFR